MDLGALPKPFHVNKSQFEFSAGPGQTAARGLTKTGWPMPALNLVPSMSKGNDLTISAAISMVYGLWS